MKAKITAKIFIALCCIISMMPFSFTEVKADNNQSLTVNITMSDSEVTFRDDPEDSRYQIGTVYVSFNASVACAGIATLYFGSTNSNVNIYQYVALPYAFSPNGLTIREINEYYQDDHPPDLFGYEVEVAWQNLDQWIICFEYRVIKSVNTGQSGPIKLTFSGIDIAPGQLLPSYPGMINAELELLNQNIELLVLNENLSDQDIEAMLGGIAGNTYNIQESLEDLLLNQYNPTDYYEYTTGYSLSLDSTFNLISTNGTIAANKDIYIKLYQPYNLFYFRGDWLYRLYIPYWSMDMNTGGTLETINIIDVTLFNDSTKATAMVDSNLEYYIQYMPGGFLLYLWNINIPQRSGFFPYLHIKAPNTIYAYGTRNINVAIFDRESRDNIDLNYKFTVMNGIERIIDAIGNITIEQTTNIDNTYNELNTYNTEINTITNNYNTQFTDLNQQLDFDDLIDVNPESENNILNTVNFYNSVFAEIIEVPSLKQILIFLLLCILIVGLIG